MIELVPKDLTLMEALAVHWVLNRVREQAIAGTPSGQALDMAIEQAQEVGLTAYTRRKTFD